MNEAQIRPMRPSDLEEVVAIERVCHPHPWSEDLFRRELENSVSRIDLFWFGDELAGYLCSWMIAGELHIHNVATAPACRRRGVAASLLRHAMERGRRQGLEAAFLEVRADNVGAIALYRKFGFAVVTRRRRYYPDGMDALLMEWRP